MSPNSPSSPTVPFIVVSPLLPHPVSPAPGRERSSSSVRSSRPSTSSVPVPRCARRGLRGSPRGMRRRDTVAFLFPT
ncbi:hypothetical protein STRIP9103_07075 [Streptomyces ipomoeae 91-03]|uniref:Uncharacterized protein n=1 Tax=Streptomyces ipomoeae 91-03 TaxID=698759 RepID=L1L0F7_9ACTN|nr:hypothetical protein STRIP9103_07075 [Streptomyces ipomoeae 91-03]